MTRPLPSEYNPYFETYIGKVPDSPVLETLSVQLREFTALLASIGEGNAGHRYAPGKWSVAQVVGHVVDTERIFGTRALAIARGEKAALPSFEQDKYVEQGNFDARTIGDLSEEFEHLRRSHLVLFRSFDDSTWLRRGTAGGNEVSVRAIAWIVAGHLIHHAQVLREWYL